MRWILLILLVGAILAGGCMTPVSPDSHPDLSRIQAEFERVVAEIHARGHEQWHSDWYGNFLVRAGGDSARGLCWQWQEAVYTGMRPFIHRMGWRAEGVALNAGESTEHHAVIVYNPARIHREDILTRPSPRPVWVLDAWRRGRADIFLFDDWVKHGAIFPRSATLENLDHGRSDVATSAVPRAATRPGSR